METAGTPPVPPTPPTPPAMTPPTELGDMPARPSTWPTVIGIIAIVFGSLGALGACATLVITALAPWFSGFVEDMPVQQAQFEVTRRFMVPMLISLMVGTPLSVWLLVAGIGLVRRRPWSRTASVGWALAKVLYVIPASVLNYVVNKATIEAMEQAAADSGQAMPGGFLVFMESLGAVGMGCGLVWSWALPIFMIVWFLRTPVREEVERWAAESRAAI